MSEAPLVSICCITYNHEPFIAQAIEGFLMQEVDFPVEIIIHDDASTDGTADIIRDYAAKHSDRIVPMLQAENQHSQGIRPFPTYVLPHARGLYIANCEGDDYWTDPHKLQKQVDFLEANPEYSLCFHDVMVVYEDGSKEPHWYCPPDQPETSGLEDIIRRNFIPTCSATFRNGLIGELPSWYYELPMGDWPLWVLLAEQGKLGYLDEVMGAYRKHGGGVYSGLVQVGKVRMELAFYLAMERVLDNQGWPVAKERATYTYYWLATLYLALGDRWETLDCLVRSVLRSPTNPSAPYPLLSRIAMRAILGDRYAWLSDSRAGIKGVITNPDVR